MTSETLDKLLEELINLATEAQAEVSGPDRSYYRVAIERVQEKKTEIIQAIVGPTSRAMKCPGCIGDLIKHPGDGEGVKRCSKCKASWYLLCCRKAEES